MRPRRTRGCLNRGCLIPALVVIALVCLLGVIGTARNNRSAVPDRVTVVLLQETPLPTSAADALMQAVRDAIGNSKPFGGGVTRAELLDPSNSGALIAFVDYDIGPQLNTSDAVDEILFDLRHIAPAVFSATLASSLELNAFAEFRDKYGQASREPAMAITLTRDLSQRIDWKNIRDRQIAVVLDTEGNGARSGAQSGARSGAQSGARSGAQSGVTVHPALLPAWWSIRQ